MLSIASILDCLPGRCRPFVKVVLKQLDRNHDGASFIYTDTVVFSVNGLKAAVSVLLNLAPQFSIECTLPRHLVNVLRCFVRTPLLQRSLVSVTVLQAAFAPEMYSLLRFTLLPGTPSGVHSFVEEFCFGLCDELNSYNDDVAPPPFEPQPGSYNPALRGAGFVLYVLSLTKHIILLSGVALYLNPKGEQGRYAKRYKPMLRGSRAQRSAGKIGLNHDQTSTCTHCFVGKRKRTGGIFR
jgi:hypothetical protein